MAVHGSALPDAVSSGTSEPTLRTRAAGLQVGLHEVPEQRDFGVGTVRTCWSWALRSDELAEPIRSDVASTLGSGWIDRGKEKASKRVQVIVALLASGVSGTKRASRILRFHFHSVRRIFLPNERTCLLLCSACLTMLRLITRDSMIPCPVGQYQPFHS